MMMTAFCLIIPCFFLPLIQVCDFLTNWCLRQGKAVCVLIKWIINEGKELVLTDGEVIPISLMVVVRGSDLKAIPQEFSQSDVYEIREWVRKELFLKMRGIRFTESDERLSKEVLQKTGSDDQSIPQYGTDGKYAMRWQKGSAVNGEKDQKTRTNDGEEETERIRCYLRKGKTRTDSREDQDDFPRRQEKLQQRRERIGKHTHNRKGREFVLLLPLPNSSYPIFLLFRSSCRYSLPTLLAILPRTCVSAWVTFSGKGASLTPVLQSFLSQATFFCPSPYFPTRLCPSHLSSLTTSFLVFFFILSVAIRGWEKDEED